MKNIFFKKTGFSLMELLAVMFIIGIIFSIAVPAFGPTMSTMRLTTASENLANAMDSAQQYAATMGENIYMVFPIGTQDPLNKKAYKIVRETGPNTGIYVTIGKLEKLPSGIEIDDTTTITNATMSVQFPEDADAPLLLNFIIFEPGGRIITNAGTDGRIQLKSIQNNTTQSVYFNNAGGKVRVEDAVTHD